jgi:hypothetical protein
MMRFDNFRGWWFQQQGKMYLALLCVLCGSIFCFCFSLLLCLSVFSVVQSSAFAFLRVSAPLRLVGSVYAPCVTLFLLLAFALCFC